MYINTHTHIIYVQYICIKLRQQFRLNIQQALTEIRNYRGSGEIIQLTLVYFAMHIDYI